MKTDFSDFCDLIRYRRVDGGSGLGVAWARVPLHFSRRGVFWFEIDDIFRILMLLKVKVDKSVLLVDFQF